jgi:hypothetical protein
MHWKSSNVHLAFLKQGQFLELPFQKDNINNVT